jgi:hypothetical protein
VAPEQIDDRIDEALAKFFEFHGDGIEKVYIGHTITQTDIQNKSITVPDSVFTVVRILPFSISSSFSTNLEYHVYMTEIMKGSASGAIGNFIVASEFMSTIQMIFNSEKGVRFNRITHRLQIDTDWNALRPGDILMMECFSFIDPIDWDEVYNNMWLKAYTTALIRRQWGTNLSKYNGFQLPSGMTLDGATILQTALQDILQLEEELRTTWENPVDFFTG